MLRKASVERIQKELEALATFNATPGPGEGITRFVFTPEEIKARAYVKGLMEEAGLTVREDAIGNIFGTLEGSQPELAPVWSGSHIDTVLHAGRYDGTVGSIGAIESCRMIRESGVGHKRSIVAVVFTSEEPTRFSAGCIGSRALTGTLTLEGTKGLRDDGGKTLYQVLEEMDYPLDKFADIPLKKGDIHAMLELHIEQAPILEQMALPIGVVTGICAPTYILVSLRGEQGHAGSTLMQRRRDTVTAAAEIILELERLARESNKRGNSSTVGTVGKINVFPNAPNVISGSTSLVIDIRDVDAQSKDQTTAAITSFMDSLAEKRGVGIDWEIVENDLPQRSAPALIALLEDICREQGIPYNKMTSGAYHDSLHIAELCPIALVFVPSKDGISHDPREFTTYEQIAAGVDILAPALLKLANE